MQNIISAQVRWTERGSVVRNHMRSVLFFTGLVLCALFLLPAVFAGVWSLGTWVGLAAGAVLAVGAHVWPRLTVWTAKKQKKWIPKVILSVFILSVVYTFSLFACMTVGALRAPPEDPSGTVVVLGSKVNGTVPSADLQARIDRAAEYLLEHPSLSVVASGGQGAGEDISEAAAIRDGLIAKGVEPSRIYLEAESSDTEENIAFSKAVMEENGLPEPMLIVTDEYHEFRAWLLAQREGIASYAVPGRTPFYLLPACVARETLAITEQLLLGWV